MISEAKRLANINNAKKSTGPRTKEGKKRSAMNALTHGLTARVTILPDEDPQAFEERMASWKEIFRPRNDVELYHTESAVYFSWQNALRSPGADGEVVREIAGIGRRTVQKGSAAGR